MSAWIRAIKISVLLLLIISSLNCKKDSSPAVSFYYWKTVFKLSDNEADFLRANQVSKLYIRYFDVGLKDNVPVPISPIVFNQSPPLPIVPVLYIKNEVLLSSSANMDDLAKRLLGLIDEISLKNGISYSALQVDCDWTKTSKSNYMRLIDLLKKKSKKYITSTIRLHQIKYPVETGVPTVDRGVLMYYNMGTIGPDTLNSIYDRTTALKYVQALGDYSLTLDIALPIFSWAIHLRNGKVIDLINKVDETDFTLDSIFELRHENRIYVKQNILKMGKFFEKGDELKIESVSVQSIREMCFDIKRHIRSSPHEVIYYDLDEHNFNKFDDEQVLKKINTIF